MEKAVTGQPSSVDHVAALSTFSTTREKLLEHRFIAEIGARLWECGIFDFSVSHSEVDNSGYDVIIEVGAVIRHIQLKASHSKGKTSKVPIQKRLTEKPSGCVVWLIHDSASLEVERFLWLGRDAGQPLSATDIGDILAKHTKADMKGRKAERPALREVARRKFTEPSSWHHLTTKLFGCE
ncbi:MAG: hypothetical protein ABJA20_07270 [Novosphingobium sp.]